MTDDPLSFLDVIRDILERLPTEPLAIIALAIIVVGFIAYIVLPSGAQGGFVGRALTAIVMVAAVVVLAWRATVIGVEVQIERQQTAAVSQG
ncbi:MAG: hypothetical protein MI723_10325 [Caulobacterales bacterium]|nr:hypothetical protein [Caulobacterales bacterium]